MSQERLYHEIACRSLTKTGPCDCTPVVVTEGRGDVLAWLNNEQKRPERWIRSGTGILHFQLTGPELMRIRRVLEIVGSLGQIAE